MGEGKGIIWLAQVPVHLRVQMADISTCNALFKGWTIREGRPSFLICHVNRDKAPPCMLDPEYSFNMSFIAIPLKELVDG